MKDSVPAVTPEPCTGKEMLCVPCSGGLQGAVYQVLYSL